MHVISRGVNEGLVIGDDISVTVLEVQDEFVRLGICSPNEVPAYREETVYMQPIQECEALYS
jgi:carbon storage regulator